MERSFDANGDPVGGDRSIDKTPAETVVRIAREDLGVRVKVAQKSAVGLMATTPQRLLPASVSRDRHQFATEPRQEGQGRYFSRAVRRALRSRMQRCRRRPGSLNSIVVRRRPVSEPAAAGVAPAESS